MSARVVVPKLLDRLGIRATASGQWFTAKCPDPDHVDRNPSWRIHRDTGKHRCFSCGFHGGPVRLVMVALGLTSNKAAAEWLDGEDMAAPASLEVEVTFKPSARRAFRLPAGVVIAPLAAWPSTPRDYISARGVTASQVDRWDLGYAVDGKQAGRVIFPVRDNRGVLISYTGRSFTGSRKKYREPDADERADPGAVFGEEHWDLDEDGLLVVTEGALDGLAVERCTGLCIAAMYGSQIEPGHLARLSRAKGLLIATDNDLPGNKIAQALQDQLARSAIVRRWVPPVGEDCASFALRDGLAFRTSLLEAWVP